MVRMENCIYKITNVVNGKVYVGRTNQLKERIQKHLNGKGSSSIMKDLKKYKKENFSIQILADGLTLKEAIDLEFKYIQYFNCLSPLGYNLTTATSFGGGELSESTKALLSKRQQQVDRRRTNKFRGVRKKRGSYQARIFIKDLDKEKSKTFATEEEAAIFYDKISLYIYGEGVKLNYPENLSEYFLDDLEKMYQDFLSKGFSSNQSGVSYHKASKKWRAYYYDKQGRQINLPLFETEEEAIENVKQYWE
jgi:group I intron endonuclease